MNFIETTVSALVAIEVFEHDCRVHHQLCWEIADDGTDAGYRGKVLTSNLLPVYSLYHKRYQLLPKRANNGEILKHIYMPAGKNG